MISAPTALTHRARRRGRVPRPTVPAVGQPDPGLRSPKTSTDRRGGGPASRPVEGFAPTTTPSSPRIGGQTLAAVPVPYQTSPHRCASPRRSVNVNGPHRSAGSGGDLCWNPHKRPSARKTRKHARPFIKLQYEIRPSSIFAVLSVQSFQFVLCDRIRHNDFNTSKKLEFIVAVRANFRLRVNIAPTIRTAFSVRQGFNFVK